MLVNDCCVTAVAADGYASCSISHINYAVSSIEALQAAGAAIVPGAAVKCQTKVCASACTVPDTAICQYCTACGISIAIPLAVVSSQAQAYAAVVTSPVAICQANSRIVAGICAIPYRSIQLNRAACSTAVAGPSCAVSQCRVQLAGISSVPGALAQAHGSVTAVVTSPACAFLEVQLYATVSICCHIAVQLAEVLSCYFSSVAISSNIAANGGICRINRYCCICAICTHCSVDLRSLRYLNIYDIICAYVTVQRCINCSDIHLAVVSVNCFRTINRQAACILNCQCGAGCCDTVTAVGSNRHIVVVQLQGCILSCSNCTAVGSNRGCVFREVIDIVSIR